MADDRILLTDVFGKSVRLTNERRAHVLEHPEMTEFGDALAEVLIQPERVVQSRTDPAVRLFLAKRITKLFGEKWLCVVVKYSESDAFIITAHLTDKIKAGEQLWPAK